MKTGVFVFYSDEFTRRQHNRPRNLLYCLSQLHRRFVTIPS